MPKNWAELLAEPENIEAIDGIFEADLARSQSGLAPVFPAACQGWMHSRSSRRLGCVGSQPSASRVWVLDEGWSVAKIGPRGP
jgi:hypothetical protein